MLFLEIAMRNGDLKKLKESICLVQMIVFFYQMLILVINWMWRIFRMHISNWDKYYTVGVLRARQATKTPIPGSQKPTCGLSAED